jgi:hypothetical protein
VNADHGGTLTQARSDSGSGSFPRQVIRFLLKGPGHLKSRLLGWGISLLAVAGAALLVWSSVIHLMLWSDGYSGISVIGPLFLAQGIGGIVIALALVIFRKMVALGAGAVTLAGTALGLLASVHLSLFGYRESLAVPYAMSSLVIEFTGAAILVIAALVLLVAPRRSLPPKLFQLLNQSFSISPTYLRVCMRWELQRTRCRMRRCSPVLVRVTPNCRSRSSVGSSGSCSASR